MSFEKYLLSCCSAGCAEGATHVLSVNPYFVFLAEFRKNLKKRGILSLKPTSVAKIAGRKWREMTRAQKSVYVEAAKINQAKMKTSKRAVRRLMRLNNSKLKGNKILPENL